MWWHYLLVFAGAFLFDVVPFPFPPAFSVMVPLQLAFGLDPWLVIVVGVAGSILGRYLLALYIPLLADKIFKAKKNREVQFLGQKMKEKGWKSQVVILAYSLLPLPTTPLFLAGGMARIRPMQIIPAFFVGKFISDALVIHMGKFAYDNFDGMVSAALSWKSIGSLMLGLLMICALLFIDWFTLLEKKKLTLNFRIWK
ncbi:small multi-drug export protein [Flavobacterium sp.]|uniref:small multi-drug export protein n=1 Tax=Flavobacterium sp. TaxID=239 RepID=UPI00261DBEBA|nr:small multi-drug export protein [Flavobacterium sp.]